MSMTLMNETTALNNVGVGHIDAGDFENAISSLTAALKSSKEIASSSNHLSDRNQNDERSDEGESYNLDRFLARQKLFRKETEDAKSDDELFVFQSAVRLPTCQNHTYDSQLTLVSIAIIFNMALAHHLCGLKSNDKKSTLMLRKAIKLYEFCLKLQKYRTSSKVFTLAAVNNMGQIYHVLGERQQSKECFQHLLSTLVSLLDSNQISAITEYEEFYYNALTLVMPNCSVVAAAAA